MFFPLYTWDSSNSSFIHSKCHGRDERRSRVSYLIFITMRCVLTRTHWLAERKISDNKVVCLSRNHHLGIKWRYFSSLSTVISAIINLTNLLDSIIECSIHYHSASLSCCLLFDVLNFVSIAVSPNSASKWVKMITDEKVESPEGKKNRSCEFSGGLTVTSSHTIYIIYSRSLHS